MGVPSVSDVLSIPTRWGGVNNAVGSLTQYFAGQQAKRQELQYNLANQLINAQALRMGYGGGQSPEIASMLNQNPYGRGLFPDTGGQGGASTPTSMPSSINANGMFGLGGGLGGMSMGAAPSFGMGGAQSAGNASNTASMGGQFNPLSQAGQPDNVATSATMENKPYIGMVPKSVDVQNVPAQARIAGAKSYSEKKAGMAAGAEESETRDIQQLAMVRNAIKPLVDRYEDVYNKKDALGIPAGGDRFGGSITKNADMFPRMFGIQSAIVPPEVQKSAGQFLANKNELVTKLQPLLSQQFGKEGSSRIMENLVKMSQQEIGDLTTPREQFHGQITGTLSSLYRIAKASQAYAKDLAASGQSNPDPNAAAQEIAKRMSMQDLSANESKELQTMIDDVLGKKALPKGADSNPQPQGMPQYDPKTQKLQRSNKTGAYRVVSL